MKTEKMTYEKPTIQKVEFDYKTAIAGPSSSSESCTGCCWCDD